MIVQDLVRKLVFNYDLILVCIIDVSGFAGSTAAAGIPSMYINII